MKNGHSLTAGGLLVALGIVYGDIGTSPLYVLKAIVGDQIITADLALGSFSAIFWTITLLTTIKYIWLALQADNRGEGGIFALFTLVRNSRSWLIFPAMIGGAALLADGIITPCISVSSAIEGLRNIRPDIPTIPLVLLIITVLFSVQQLGTKVVGRSFGPLILVWFSMLGVLGVFGLLNHPEVLKGLNPWYAINFLVNSPGGFWILGAVFLCTTGAEALYSDLGHCGKSNIRISWGLVKTCLLLNYAGQTAWLMNFEGSTISGKNPFFELMPSWFLPFGIMIATVAAIIASQALISGTFTLITEAMRLNLFPKVRVIFPTELRGQIYVPMVNWAMWIGCLIIVLYFKESANMEAAYGLSININMLMTTILLTFYLQKKSFNSIAIKVFFFSYIFIESCFLIANLEKFLHGGWVSMGISLSLFSVMWIWLNGFKIKKRYTEYEEFKKHLPTLKELAVDDTVPKFATHLVYLTEAHSPLKIEKKVIYSLFQRRPKRADTYWFLHVEVVDEPYAREYQVETLIPGVAFRIDYKLGFRVEPRMNRLFRHVIQEMSESKEVEIVSRYESLRKHNIPGDFRFVVLRKFLSADNELSTYEKILMRAYFYFKRILGIKESTGFGLDTSSVTVETYPLVLSQLTNVKMQRTEAK